MTTGYFLFGKLIKQFFFSNEMRENKKSLIIIKLSNHVELVLKRLSPLLADKLNGEKCIFSAKRKKIRKCL